MSHTRTQQPAPLSPPHTHSHSTHHAREGNSVNVVRRGRAPVIAASVTTLPYAPDPPFESFSSEEQTARSDDSAAARVRRSHHRHKTHLRQSQSQSRSQTRETEPTVSASDYLRADLPRTSSSSSFKRSTRISLDRERDFRSSTMPPSTSRKAEAHSVHRHHRDESVSQQSWDAERRLTSKGSHSSLKETASSKKFMRPELIRSSTGSGSSIRRIFGGHGPKKDEIKPIRVEEYVVTPSLKKERRKTSSPTAKTKEEIRQREEHRHHRHRLSRGDSYIKEDTRSSKVHTKDERERERRPKEKRRGSDDKVQVEEVEEVVDTPRRPREHKRRVKRSTKEAVVKPKEPELLVTCTTCLSDDIPLSQSATLACTHTFCSDCLVRLFTLSLTDPQHMPPKCCTADHIPLQFVQNLLSNDTKFLWNKKYSEFTTANRIYCYVPTCGEWIRPEDIDHATNTGICSRCQASSCTLCNQQCHTGSDCPKDEELLQIRALGAELGWQRCYSCRSMVELEKGCNHMTCRCKAEFCMLCGLQWKTCECPWFNFDPDPNDLPGGLEDDLVWEEQGEHHHPRHREEDGEWDEDESDEEGGSMPHLLVSGWRMLDRLRQTNIWDMDMGFGGNSESDGERSPRVRSRVRSRSRASRASSRRGTGREEHDLREGILRAHTTNDFDFTDHRQRREEDDAGWHSGDGRAEYQTPAERSFMPPVFSQRAWIGGM